jgi:hypothetical protein
MAIGSELPIAAIELTVVAWPGRSGDEKRTQDSGRKQDPIRM